MSRQRPPLYPTQSRASGLLCDDGECLIFADPNRLGYCREQYSGTVKGSRQLPAAAVYAGGRGAGEERGSGEDSPGVDGDDER